MVSVCFVTVIGLRWILPENLEIPMTDLITQLCKSVLYSSRCFVFLSRKTVSELRHSVISLIYELNLLNVPERKSIILSFISEDKPEKVTVPCSPFTVVLVMVNGRDWEYLLEMRYAYRNMLSIRAKLLCF